MKGGEQRESTDAEKRERKREKKKKPHPSTQHLSNESAALAGHQSRIRGTKFSESKKNSKNGIKGNERQNREAEKISEATVPPIMREILPKVHSISWGGVVRAFHLGKEFQL